MNKKQFHDMSELRESTKLGLDRKKKVRRWDDWDSPFYELSGLRKCDCGRSYCQFFTPNSENGTSYSRKEIEKMREDVGELKKHLTKILRRFK